MASAEIVILGGGPAGLGAALWTAEQGRAVVLVERAPTFGGMAASLEVGGVRADLGSHRLHPSTPPEVLATLTRLLGDELQRRPRRGRVLIAHRWVSFPLSPRNLLANLPPATAARMAVGALGAPLRRPRTDTFAEVVRTRLGRAVGRELHLPYAIKLWGLPPDALAGEQARRRIATTGPLSLAARALGRGPRWFWYPARGFGRIPEVLAEEAVRAGATLVAGVAATRVHLRLDGVTVRLADGRDLDAGAVWSTLPLPTLARLADAPAPVREAASRLTHRALVLVYLVSARRQWTPFDAHYIPCPSTPVARVSEPRNYRDGPDPPDRTVLCAEIPCAPTDPAFSADPDTLAGLVREDLVRLGLPDPEPIGAEVRRIAAAYPVYALGYERALTELRRWVADLPRVRTLGRLGLFAHDNTHHALAEAHRSAATADDDAAWAASMAVFDRHVVED